jgi:hypothetical protein
MKRIITLIAAIIVSASVSAQSPQKMSYQAVIRNSSNALVTSKSVGMRISVLQGSASGTVVYTETQTPTTNANGLVSIEIGGGAGFSTIDWSNGVYYIKTETDPSGGTNYTISGTSQVLSVPYALHSKTAETLTGNSTGFTHYVGELFGGGIVVSVWKVSGVEHGLIASLTDISASIVAWSNIAGTVIGPTAQSPVDGQANTTAIVAQAGQTNSAAKLCDDYTSGGFSDWYLPALWELNKCYEAAFIVNTVLGTINGFRVAAYWSSTEYSLDSAWNFSFDYGYAYNLSKGNFYRVRAVRKF